MMKPITTSVAAPAERQFAPALRVYSIVIVLALFSFGALAAMDMRNNWQEREAPGRERAP